jgi:hypothetical protein
MSSELYSIYREPQEWDEKAESVVLKEGWGFWIDRNGDWNLFSSERDPRALSKAIRRLRLDKTSSGYAYVDEKGLHMDGGDAVNIKSINRQNFEFQAEVEFGEQKLIGRVMPSLRRMRNAA